MVGVRAGTLHLNGCRSKLVSSTQVQTKKACREQDLLQQ